MLAGMDQLFRFDQAIRRNPEVDAWFEDRDDELGAIAQKWFGVLRACSRDVQELLHDGHPTACVQDAAFAYVNAFKAHVNVGFFRGASLVDPEGLLEGSGKLMRHVKLRPGTPVNEAALTQLIKCAHEDMQRRLEME